MRPSVIAMTLVLVVGLASAGVSDAYVPAENTVKLYYGLPGSNDYVLGTAGPQEPSFAWQQHSSMPTAMMDNAAAANETHVYVAAGYSIGRVFYRHEVGGTTWETLAQCPLDLSTGGAALIGDTFYYCGGYKNSMRDPADTLFKYSISGNDWTSGPGPYSGSVGYNWMPSVFACMGKLYFVSGCQQPGATNPTRQVHCYTPGAGWARVADLNQGSVFAAGWVYNDTIWFAGGNYNNSGITRTEFYDPVADTWIIDNAVFPQIPYSIWGPASGAVGNIGYIATGVVSTGQLTDSVMYFNHGTGTWSVDEPVYLKVYRTAGAGNADGKAIVYGGSTGGFTPTPICQFELVAPPPDSDVGVASIVQPEGTIEPGVIAPKIIIQNFGLAAIGDIACTFWIDSGDVYDETVNYPGPLGPGASDTVTFPDWNATAGEYVLTAFTYVAGDVNPNNDSMMGRVQVTSSNIVWSRLGDAPAPGRYWSPGTGVCRDTLWFLGGRSASNIGLASITGYDILGGNWLTAAETLQTGRRAGAGGQIGNKIYACGGRSRQSQTLNTVEEYDLDAKTVTYKASMPSGAWASCGAVAGGKVYVIGNESRTGSTFEYDPATNTWSTKASVSPGRGWSAAAGAGGKVYVFGGISTTELRDVQCFDPATNAWSAKADMPGVRVYHSAVTVDDSIIYVIGGATSQTADNLVWRYSVLGNSWTVDTPMLTPSGWHMLNVGTSSSNDGQAIYVGYGSDCSTPTYLTKLEHGLLPTSGIYEYVPDRMAKALDVTPSIGRGLMRISYSVANAGLVNLDVYDASGSLVRTLVDGVVAEPGTQTVVWDRADDMGRRVSKGTYFYRLSVDGQTLSSKSVVLD